MTGPTPILDRRRVLALAAESAHGLAASITNANAGFRIEDRDISIIRETGMAEQAGSGGFAAGVAEAAHTALTLSAFLVGSGTTNQATLLGLLMPACGFVYSAGTYSRTWAGTNWTSLSANDYRDGVVWKARGLMGSMKMTLRPGMRCGIEANMLGGYVAEPADAALLTGMTYQSASPPIWSPSSGTSGGMLTLDSQTIFRVGALEIDLNNQFALRENENAAGGYDGGWLETGATKWTLDPEAYSRATYDWPTMQKNGTTFTVSTVIGQTTHNIITASMTAQVLTYPGHDKRNGKVTEKLVFIEVGDSFTLVES